MEDNNGDKSFEELLVEITNTDQRIFLEHYPKFNTTVGTCEAIGICEATPYNWRNKDGVFNKAFIALKKDLALKLVELHEKNIDDIAFDKLSPAQSRIFGSLVRLRAEAPDKYREKQSTPTLIGNVTIKMAVPEYKELPFVDAEVKEIAEG